MQQGGFTSSYYQFPNSSSTNPNSAPFDHQLPPQSPASAPGPGYASAPPFAPAAAAAAYSPADYSSFSHNYPPFSQNPDPAPPPPTNSNPNSQYAAPPPYYPPYDQNPTAVNYLPYGNSYSSSNPSSSVYPVTPFGNVSSSVGSYENPYESVPVPKFDSNPGYFDDNLSRLGGYGRSGSDLGSDLYGKRPENSQYDYGFCKDDGYGDGVYAYKGKTEPYGARGTDSKSSTWSGMFDDYGRAISFPSDKKSSVKVVKAVPKAEANTDVKSGVLKFRVKLLPESGGQSVMDVLCTVGLDGIRMLDPSTSRTLRIYPLETVTRCEKYDSSTFAFWSKTSVDIEPRRIRLQSSSYTTNTILDTVTAATVQFKEMGGRIRPPESSKVPELPSEKKKGFTDWINRLKPVNEEKDHWIPDEAASKCTACGSDFGAFLRRHHCRNCGDIFCDKCTQGRIALTADADAQPVRVCDRCMAEVTLRLNKAKEAASKPVSLQSHEDLARKLQEEMEKNLKISSGGKADGSGRRMREVACPTCTVHLQVQVPASGSETIECGVCQHPFLVSSH